MIVHRLLGCSYRPVRRLTTGMLVKMEEDRSAIDKERLGFLLRPPDKLKKKKNNNFFLRFSFHLFIKLYIYFSLFLFIDRILLTQ